MAESAIKKTKSENVKLKNEKILKENNEKLQAMESRKDRELALLQSEFKSTIREKGLSKHKNTSNYNVYNSNVAVYFETEE